MGSLDKFLEFHSFILNSLKSTTFIWISGHLSAKTDIVGPPTYPAPIQQIFLISTVIKFDLKFFLFYQSYITNNKLQKVENEWLHNLAYLTQIVVKKSDINIQHGKLLYSLVSNLDKKIENLTILETGTARGFSSICMSRALIDANRNGKIYTVDILPHDTKMYWNCIDDHDGMKSRKELLKNWSKETDNIVFTTRGI